MNHGRPTRKSTDTVRLVGMLVIAAACVIGGLAAAQKPATRPTPASLSDIGPVEGRGNWGVHTDNPGDPGRPRRGPHLAEGLPGIKQWRATLTPHADKSVTGDISVDVGEQKLIRHGTVRARYEHGRIWGEIFDDDGEQAATFEGVLGDSGVEGSYTARNDDTGTFTWDGALPTPAD